MLTDEQLLKAKRALALRKNEDVEKALAFEWHKRAKKALHEYGIPYRVYFDYLKDRYYNPKDTIAINPCYPLPGYPADKLVRVSHDDFIIPEQIPEGMTLEDIYVYDNLGEAKKLEVDKLCYDVKPWKVFDENWKQYFTMYFVGYDFRSFGEFEFIGETGTLERGDLGLLRNYFEYAIMGEYQKHKDDYMLSTPKYEPEYRFLYSDKPFEIVWDVDTIKERALLEKAMNLPRDERARELYMKEYGIDIYG